MNSSINSLRTALRCESEVLRGIILLAILLIISCPLPIFGKAVEIMMNWGGMQCPELIISTTSIFHYVSFAVLLQLLFGLVLIPVATGCLKMLKPLSLGCRLTTVCFFSAASIFAIALLLGTI